MNAPTSPALAPAIRAAASTSSPSGAAPPSSPAPTSPGVATATLGWIVAFAASPVKLSPQTLRDTVEKRMIADLGARAFVTTTDSKGVSRRVIPFVDSLPEVITPVAALGLATRVAVVAATSRAPATRWIFSSQKDGCSRWIYADADVTDDHARIVGNAGAEARKNGDLVVDAAIPPAIAAKLRSAYDDARGVVEPAKVNAAVSRYLRDAHGQQLSVGTFLLPTASDDVRAVLAALVDLGGFAGCYPINDTVNAAALAAPMARSLEDDVAEVLKSAAATIERAKAAQGKDGPSLQERTGETAHAAIDDVKARLGLWRDRLGLALSDVDAKLSEAERTLDAEIERALAAVARRKRERAAAKAKAASGDDA